MSVHTSKPLGHRGLNFSFVFFVCLFVPMLPFFVSFYFFYPTLHPSIKKNIQNLFQRWFYPLQMALTTFNRGLLLMMTIERWFVICRPLTSMQKFQNKRRFMTIILILVTWSLLINLPRCWEYSSSPYCYTTTNATDALGGIRYSLKIAL